MHGRICTFAAVFLPLLAGCGASPSLGQEPEEQEITLGAAFESTTVGSISGRVTWEGDVPAAKESLVRAIACNPKLHLNPARFETLHVPKVDRQTHGVANAVVFLRGVDSRRSKPWDLPKPRVEFHERRLIIQQGERRSAVGFVPRGGAIEFVNRDAEYHNLHGRGDAFFSMPLLERARVHTRVLSQPGLVNLSCGAGYYWMHAHLFVVEHPYYTRTDSQGRFTLAGVPPGKYELVSWLANWHITQAQRDPETGIIVRFLWAPPIERTQTVRVESGGNEEVGFVMRAEQ